MPSDGYIVVYLEILFLSFLTAAIIYSKVSHDLGSEDEVYAFRWILRIYMTMMAIDSFTQMQYRNVIHPPTILASCGSAAYMALLSILAIVWFFFAELQIDPQLTRVKWFRFLAVLPGAIVAFMCFASVRTGWIFGYDETGTFFRGPFFFVQNVIAYFYFLFTTCHAFYAAERVTSMVKKRRLRKIASFIIAPTIGAMLQLLFGGFPFVGPSISVSILSIFISIQGDMVNTDFLTGLNNRKSMERYLEKLLPGVSHLNPLYLFIIDADHFKQINDSYGHLEGDRALKLIADALRYSVDNCQGYIARLGGDEFVAVLEGTHFNDPDAFCNSINMNLEAARRKKEVAYELSVSIGYVKCESPDTNTRTLLKDADAMMYVVKREKTSQQLQ